MFFATTFEAALSNCAVGFYVILTAAVITLLAGPFITYMTLWDIFLTKPAPDVALAVMPH